MGLRSRNKGKRGEREAAAKWSALFGRPMHRSQQYCGRAAESDDIIGHPGISIEVKRRERFNLDEAIDRTADDAAADSVPLVLHRKDHRPWLVTVRLDDLPELAARLRPVSANQPLPSSRPTTEC